MYIRKTTRKVKDKIYENYLLVESVMTPKGPRQRTICSLGHLKPRARKEWLLLAQKVETALRGQLTFEEEEPEVERQDKQIGIPALPNAPEKSLAPAPPDGTDCVCRCHFCSLREEEGW